MRHCAMSLSCSSRVPCQSWQRRSGEYVSHGEHCNEVLKAGLPALSQPGEIRLPTTMKHTKPLKLLRSYKAQFSRTGSMLVTLSRDFVVWDVERRAKRYRAHPFSHLARRRRLCGNGGDRRQWTCRVGPSACEQRCFIHKHGATLWVSRLFCGEWGEGTSPCTGSDPRSVTGAPSTGAIRFPVMSASMRWRTACRTRPRRRTSEKRVRFMQAWSDYYFGQADQNSA